MAEQPADRFPPAADSTRRPPAADLTGEWSGHYEQDGARHAIRMTVQQFGGRFVGTMHDTDTLFLGSLDDSDDADPLPGLRECGSTPDDALPLGFVSSLPAESHLDGAVDGGAVAIRKTYLGDHACEFWLGDHDVRLVFPDYEVTYSGQLAEDGAVLHGTWQIGRDAEDAELGNGDFVLARCTS